MKINGSSVDIVIVNWNSASLLADCLNSIFATDMRFVRSVVVVDNASTDNSLAEIERFDLSLKLIRNAENRGFAAACNQGAADAKGDYLLFLNPDTRLFEDSLRVPLAFMGRPENSDVGICGVQLVDSMGRTALSSARFPSPRQIVMRMLGLEALSAGNRRLLKAIDGYAFEEVDQVIGAFFLIRRAVFERLDGFDENFFMYYEEVDLSLRAKQAGWRSVILNNAQVYHKGQGCSDRVKPARLFYWNRSRILYSFKHFSPVVRWALLVLSLTVEPLARCVRAVVRRSWIDLTDTLRGYAMLFGSLTHIISMALTHNSRRRSK